MNDLEFNMYGYCWVVLNCLIGAGYTLYMNLTMINTKLGNFGNAFYNNLLSIPFLSVFIFINKEIYNISNQPINLNYYILFYNGIAACFLSFSSFLVIKVTSPTTYSITGALNKIPTTIIGIVFFHTPLNKIGSIAMFFALMGGVIYAIAKKREVPPPPSPSLEPNDIENEKVILTQDNQKDNIKA